MKGYNGYRWQVVLGRLSRVLQMVGNVTKRFTGIVKVGCQLKKACSPARAIIKGIKCIIES
jgi:hypothetical protein